MPDPGYFDPGTITRFDLHYHYKRWGIGGELAGFTTSPFAKVYSWGGSDFVDLIFYPNLNHTFPIKEEWYVKVSAGMYFAFSKQGSYTNQYPDTGIYFSYEGDAIPGVGVNFGKRF